MNLSTLYRPLELTFPWADAMRCRTASAPSPIKNLTDLQYRLLALHITQATPRRPAEARPEWPNVTLFISLMFVALVIATGGWP